MARPIWTGMLSFGLLNIPVSLMPGERRVDLQLHMLDARDNAPVRYERVNAETGEEVPWKEVVKAFEYSKGNYVVLEPEDLKAASPEGREVVEVEAFVDLKSIAPQFFEKPYILVPGKKAEKGYVLLRETLASMQRAGIARVVIRTREYLCAVIPQGTALVAILLRYAQELIDPAEYELPEGEPAQYRISDQELKMATQLIEAMSDTWQPASYKDEFRQRLAHVIDERVKSQGIVAKPVDEQPVPEGATTNVVDFMALLKKSLAKGKGGKDGENGKKAVTALPASGKGVSVPKPARKPIARKPPDKPAGGQPGSKAPSSRSRRTA